MISSQNGLALALQPLLLLAFEILNVAGEHLVEAARGHVHGFGGEIGELFLGIVNEALARGLHFLVERGKRGIDVPLEFARGAFGEFARGLVEFGGDGIEHVPLEALPAQLFCGRFAQTLAVVFHARLNLVLHLLADGLDLVCGLACRAVEAGGGFLAFAAGGLRAFLPPDRELAPVILGDGLARGFDGGLGLLDLASQILGQSAA